MIGRREEWREKKKKGERERERKNITGRVGRKKKKGRSEGTGILHRPQPTRTHNTITP